MAVPKRRQSKMKGRKRRTHYTAVIPTISECPRCHTNIPPHVACPHCGYYHGRLVLPPEKTIENRLRKQSEEAEK